MVCPTYWDLHFLQVIRWIKLLNLQVILEGTINVLLVVVLLIKPLMSSLGQYLQLLLLQILEGFTPPLGLGSLGG